MEVVLLPKAVKYYNKLNEPYKSRVEIALSRMEKEPPEGDIKSLTGSNEFRLRVGDLRILFAIESDTIFVTDMGPRGQIYRGRKS